MLTRQTERLGLRKRIKRDKVESRKRGETRNAKERGGRIAGWVAICWTCPKAITNPPVASSATQHVLPGRSLHRAHGRRPRPQVCIFSHMCTLVSLHCSRHRVYDLVCLATEPRPSPCFDELQGHITVPKVRVWS